ncbi:MAG: hypothetical protein A3J74_07500 [Elusimicrobia bacterium RIFCSPHIGHO2_02_FULL_57_9]|nr:MAG: hypothetical protein A3J74_07500 [Elusimicrobia bacterium RIFCSPHIGHO2_02_FULL_57_9]
MRAYEDLSQLWMVPYADLMSTLVILFMALFAYAYSQKSPEYARALAQIETDVAGRKQADRAQARLQETEMAVQIKKEMNRLALDDFGVEVTSRYIRLTLPTPVIFAEGSQRLSPRAKGLLEALARLFSEVSNPVLVEGHSDNLPIVGGGYRSNWELSAARSFSVIKFLISQDMDPQRFHARGYGEYRPLAANDTREGRKRNRRIEISLIREIHKEAVK